MPMLKEQSAMSQQLATSADEGYCRELTRREAANFYWGFIALPHDQRNAIYALYSFARQVDDETDGDNAPTSANLADLADIRARLQRQRERIEQCYAGRAQDPVMRVLAHVVQTYGIPQSELEALVDGVEMDLTITRYADWPHLRTYCEHVASSVGRMCVRIFGFTDAAALTYADDLGVAMQLANILRDVREDAGLGRIYLPQDELRHYGIHERTLLSGGVTDGWEALVQFEVTRARKLFASGLRVSHVIPRRSAACVLTMSGIYETILEQIARDPSLPLKRRISLDGRAKVAVLVRSWLRAM